MTDDPSMYYDGTLDAVTYPPPRGRQPAQRLMCCCDPKVKLLLHPDTPTSPATRALVAESNPPTERPT